ncbi:TRAP transporter substrate-binding protein [Hippea maritima]|uniref:Extracellular solute-binding protein, family 7 n=1 Tax=Hippea maritima (strain ATCC 700847 / DSM 10411 / MH2) TaxID=760142 RepID=F2LUH6_HIPMA|nr:TRAP transporter substrate-binding protein [Hippea maritima]AEA33502.1 Extracellular solute-binding protein, family 7 [Hippea maritima DSM 10411]
MRFFRVFVVLLTILFLSSFSNAKTIKMNLNCIYGPNSIHTEGAMKFAELVKKYTHGSVVITVYPGGSLGFKGPELLRVVRDGQVPMSDILMGVVSGSEHVFGVSSLPKLVNSYEEAFKLYQAFKPLYEKAALRWNQKFLYAAPWPPSGLVTKVKIESAKDLKGLKIRTYDKNGAKFLRILGANAVSMPWGEVYSALRTNLINGVLTSAESTKNGKFWEVLKYFSPINYAYPLNMVTINLDYWKALDKKQQQAILRAAKETEKYQWAYSEKINNEDLKIIQGHSMVVNEPTEEFERQMEKASRQLVEEFLDKASPSEKKILREFIK